ncbi:CAP domain-containing protein [Nocardioides panacisoli]|uniref:SCP domain-containing protein n=1 Tax=Nocardioides panacisoli TaxID=627624 RepID=A0ABP7IJ99_9ACTN
MGKSTIAASILLAILALAGPALGSQPYAQAEDPNAKAARANPAFERQVVKIVNKKRVAHGCHKLKINNAVHRAARRHTNKQAVANELSHQLPGEPWVGLRLTIAGYNNWTRVGEVVAEGYQTPKQVVQGWLDDIPHRRILLDCHFKDTGVGYAEASDGTPYWTQDFGRK